MAKSLSERLALFVRNDTKPRKSFPDVLALQPEIEQALKEGWTIRQIWTLLHAEGKIKCSYQWFVTLINRHVNAHHTGTPSSMQHNKRRNAISTETQANGFNYQSTINKEDLI